MTTPWQAKIPLASAEDIRRRIDAGESYRQISERYGISTAMISHIRSELRGTSMTIQLRDAGIRRRFCDLAKELRTTPEDLVMRLIEECAKPDWDRAIARTVERTRDVLEELAKK